MADMNSEEKGKDAWEMEEFRVPAIYDFAPFFTLQPTRSSTTRAIQLRSWAALILAWARQYRLFSLDLTLSEAAGTVLWPGARLFHHGKLNRHLSPSDLRIIIDWMCETVPATASTSKMHDPSLGLNDPESYAEDTFTLLYHTLGRPCAEWFTANSCWLYWNSLDRWANLIYAWASENSPPPPLPAIYTLQELSSKSSSSVSLEASQRFDDLPLPLLLRSLGILAQSKRAILLGPKGQTITSLPTNSSNSVSSVSVAGVKFLL